MSLPYADGSFCNCALMADAFIVGSTSLLGVAFGDMSSVFKSSPHSSTSVSLLGMNKGASLSSASTQAQLSALEATKPRGSHTSFEHIGKWWCPRLRACD